MSALVGPADATTDQRETNGLTGHDPERWKGLVVIATVLVTVIVAIAAGLQIDATIRADRANHDSQLFAIKTMGELERSGMDIGYELSTLEGVTREISESAKYLLQSLRLSSQGDSAAADQLTLQSDAAGARAERLQSLSVLYTDPRYAPETDDAAPDWPRYVADTNAPAQELLAQQNAASDEYHKWNGRADSYVVVLTVLAIALFLLGLAQALTPRLRLPVAILGMATAGLATLGMGLTALG